MTPDERRARAEYVVKMAEQGLLAEPAYDREAWRQEQESAETPRESSQTSRPSSGRDNPAWRSRQESVETSQEAPTPSRGDTRRRRKTGERRSA